MKFKNQKKMKEWEEEEKLELTKLNDENEYEIN